MSSYKRIREKEIAEMLDLFPRVKGNTNTERYREIGRRMKINATTVMSHIDDKVEHLCQSPNLYDQIEVYEQNGLPTHEAVNRVMAYWTGGDRTYSSAKPTSEKSFQMDRHASGHGKGFRGGGVWV